MTFPADSRCLAKVYVLFIMPVCKKGTCIVLLEDVEGINLPSCWQIRCTTNKVIL